MAPFPITFIKIEIMQNLYEAGGALSKCIDYPVVFSSNIVDSMLRDMSFMTRVSIILNEYIKAYICQVLSVPPIRCSQFLG